MKKKLILIASVAAMVASPSLAQGRSGGGNGNGPPMAPPGQMGGAGSSDRAGGIAAQRGEFGRTFAQEQRMNATQRAEQTRMNVTRYRGQSEQRRAEALQYAQSARGNANLPAKSSKEIRSALKSDMESWRETFQVGRKEWQAMRDQWLVNRNTLSPQQWAEQRANWFAARDAWIESQKDWAQIYRQ